MLGFTSDGWLVSGDGSRIAFRAIVYPPARDGTGAFLCRAEIADEPLLTSRSPWPEDAYRLICEAVRNHYRNRGLQLVDASGHRVKLMPPVLQQGSDGTFAFPALRQDGFARHADGSLEPVTVEVGTPYRIGVSPGREFACSVYHSGEGELGPLFDDTPDNVYAAAFRLLRRNFARDNSEFVDASGAAVPVMAPLPGSAG